MQAWIGWIGVLQAIGYSVLQHYHLTDFTGLVDAVVTAISSTLGVGGAAVLHNAEPPKPEQ